MRVAVLVEVEGAAGAVLGVVEVVRVDAAEPAEQEGVVVALALLVEPLGEVQVRIFTVIPTSVSWAAITCAAVTVSGYSLVTIRLMVRPVTPAPPSNRRAWSGSCRYGA